MPTTLKEGKPLSGTRILIAEDNADLRELFTRVFVRAGGQVRAAVDGVEALDELAAEVPELVVLDIDMPMVSGLEVLHHIRTQPDLFAIKVIILTGNDYVVNTIEASAADLCLVKPVNLPDLVMLAQRILR